MSYGEMFSVIFFLAIIAALLHRSGQVGWRRVRLILEERRRDEAAWGDKTVKLLAQYAIALSLLTAAGFLILGVMVAMSLPDWMITFVSLALMAAVLWLDQHIIQPRLFPPSDEPT